MPPPEGLVDAALNVLLLEIVQLVMFTFPPEAWLDAVLALSMLMPPP